MGIRLLRAADVMHNPAQWHQKWACACTGAAEVGMRLLRGSRSGHAPAQGQQKWACACSGAAEMGMRLFRGSRSGHAPAQGKQKWACACSGAAEVGMRLLRGSRSGHALGQGQYRLILLFFITVTQAAAPAAGQEVGVCPTAASSLAYRADRSHKDRKKFSFHIFQKIVLLFYKTLAGR
jgi:hypothetical protein